MQTVSRELHLKGQYPTRRICERRLEALPASLPVRIGLGRYLVELISSPGPDVAKLPQSTARS